MKKGESKFGFAATLDLWASVFIPNPFGQFRLNSAKSGLNLKIIGPLLISAPTDPDLIRANSCNSCKTGPHKIKNYQTNPFVIFQFPPQTKGIPHLEHPTPMKNEPISSILPRGTSEHLPCPICMLGKSSSRRGFTLIELLVVMAIIGILSSLIVGVMSRATVGAAKAVATTERAEIGSAIQEYHDKLGFYPPDNPNDSAMNPLWFELSGTTNNGVNYVTLDGSGQIQVAEINAKFNRQGFANSGTRAHGTDENAAPISFLSNLQGKQLGQSESNQPFIKILNCSAGAPPGTTLNPWHYVSTHPTHNPGSYDLWVDLVAGGKTYQVNNWSKP
jgi:prepilin-type N-terminal cleavage/methylation domain-containing protein